MAKFCGNCGSQLEDDARVCGYCGVMQAENPTIPGITDTIGNDKAKKIKDIVKKVIPAVLAVVVLVVGISVGSGFVGYKGAIRKYMKAYENMDAEKVFSMLSNVYTQYSEDFEDEFVDQLTDTFADEVEEKFGTDLKIKYEIVKADKLSDRKFDKVIEDLEGDLSDDVSFDDIKEIREVKLKVVISGSEKKTPKKDRMEFYLFKEGGEWKIFIK